MLRSRRSHDTAQGIGPDLDTMKVVIISAGMILAFFGIVFGMVFIVEGGNIARARVFDPLYEEVRQQTFEHSRVYREGLARELQSMRYEYVQANAEQKSALASVILHRTAGVSPGTLPADLEQFISQLRNQRSF